MHARSSACLIFLDLTVLIMITYESNLNHFTRGTGILLLISTVSRPVLKFTQSPNFMFLAATNCYLKTRICICIYTSSFSSLYLIILFYAKNWRNKICVFFKDPFPFKIHDNTVSDAGVASTSELCTKDSFLSETAKN
jgi:hypothetical protein